MSCKPDDLSVDHARSAAAYLSEKYGPILDEFEAQMEFGTVAIPPGLTREARRAFLDNNPVGTLVLDDMNDDEFEDFLADPERHGRHASTRFCRDRRRALRQVGLSKEAAADPKWRDSEARHLGD